MNLYKIYSLNGNPPTTAQYQIAMNALGQKDKWGDTIVGVSFSESGWVNYKTEKQGEKS